MQKFTSQKSAIIPSGKYILTLRIIWDLFGSHSWDANCTCQEDPRHRAAKAWWPGREARLHAASASELSRHRLHKPQGIFQSKPRRAKPRS